MAQGLYQSTKTKKRVILVRIRDFFIEQPDYDLVMDAFDSYEWITKNKELIESCDVLHVSPQDKEKNNVPLKVRLFIGFK